jgi:F-type H+-transporting ATPase subunit delta
MTKLANHGSWIDLSKTSRSLRNKRKKSMRIHLGGSSRQSLVTARVKLDAAVKGATSAASSELSTHLFFAANVLSRNTSLRRAFADPSRDAASKGALVKGLFGKSLSAMALEILTDVAALRWSSAGDLVHVLEQLAIEAEATAANINNELDRVEDELFETSHIVIDNFELRKALVGTGTPEAKSALISEVLAKKASPSTVKLAVALVTSLRGRSIEAAFADYLFGLANRRNRLIAVIRVASEISDAQKARLATAIEKQVGQPIRVNLEVDSSILGGVSVKFADELVDGSVSNRLASAGRALAGNK